MPSTCLTRRVASSTLIVGVRDGSGLRAKRNDEVFEMHARLLGLLVDDFEMSAHLGCTDLSIHGLFRARWSVECASHGASPVFFGRCGSSECTSGQHI